MKGRPTTTYRTVAQVEAEYDAVRAAYLKSLTAESVSISHAAGGHSLTRTNSADLRKQMLELEEELHLLATVPQKVKVRGVTPVG